MVRNSGRPRPEEHEAHVPVVGGGVGVEYTYIKHLLSYLKKTEFQNLF